MKKIVMLGASPTYPSQTSVLLDHIAARLKREAVRVDTLHLCDLPSQALFEAASSDPAIAAALRLVGEADGIVMVTPVTKAAYSGLLKNFLGLLPQAGLQGKVVLPLAIGESPAHLLVLDRVLRPMLGSLAARRVLESVYALDLQIAWTEETGLRLAPAVERRMNEAVAHLGDAVLPQHAWIGELPPHSAFMPMMAR